MSAMTTKERFLRVFDHKETDRVPIADGPWAGTLSRWKREGMSMEDWRDYFDVDKLQAIGADISPRYEYKVIEETDRYIISTTPWGVTMKNFKEEDSTPQMLDVTITSKSAWEEAKKRLTIDKSRIDWKFLKENHPKWVADGRWIQALFCFGFDVTQAGAVGTEAMLIAMIEEPEWVKDMFNTYLDMCIKHFDMIWDAGYTFDSLFWPDDMGYKNTTFFSIEMYRELLKPVHKRAVEWAHKKGIPAHLHSCGYIMPFIKDLVEIGVDAINPIEIKAGMDVLKLKQEYGDKLVLHGGLNAFLWNHEDEIIAEIERLVPILKENSGYIFSSDHSIPNTVSLKTFKKIIETVKRVGAY